MSKTDLPLEVVGWAAKRLNVGVKWVYAQCEAGKFPHYKVGRYTRVAPPEVEAWIEANRGTGTSMKETPPRSGSSKRGVQARAQLSRTTKRAS